MPKRIIRKQVHIGARFETIVYNTAYRQGFYPQDIPDGCKVIGKNKLIRVPTPYDMVIHDPRMMRSVFLDCKSTALKKLPLSILKKHQTEELEKCASAGHKAGYLVFFSSLNEVRWMSIGFFLDEGLKAIAPEHGILLGKENDFSLHKIWDR